MRARSQWKQHIKVCRRHAEWVTQRLSVNKCLECVSLASAKGETYLPPSRKVFDRETGKEKKDEEEMR